VHLYHDVFTAFTSVYQDKTREIPLDIQKHIFNLCSESSGLYKTDKKERGESKRLNAILPIYTSILGEKMQSHRVARGEADVAITTVMNDGQMALRGLVEFKNEIGAGGCDPNLQGHLSYMKYWATDAVCVRPTLSMPNLHPFLSLKRRDTSAVVLRL
jgi:hypothetical protein